MNLFRLKSLHVRIQDKSNEGASPSNRSNATWHDILCAGSAIKQGCLVLQARFKDRHVSGLSSAISGMGDSHYDDRCHALPAHWEGACTDSSSCSRCCKLCVTSNEFHSVPAPGRTTHFTQLPAVVGRASTCQHIRGYIQPRQKSERAPFRRQLATNPA